MAKKKKGKHDARGYGQNQQQQQQQKSKLSSAATTRTTATAVTSKTHDGLKNLLGTLEDTTNTSNNIQAATATATSTSTASIDTSTNNATSNTDISFTGHSNTTTTTTTTPPPSFAPPPLDMKKFTSNLSQIITELEENLGFYQEYHKHYINEMVRHLGYNVTSLEKALDWLCFHVPTLELPPLFTDGTLRDSLSTITTEQSLTVLKFVPAPASSSKITSTLNTSAQQKEQNDKINQEKQQQQAAAAAKKAEEEKARQKKKEEEDEAAARKAWLLQQYQFEDNNDYDYDDTEEQEHNYDNYNNPNNGKDKKEYSSTKDTGAVVSTKNEQILLSSNRNNMIEKSPNELELEEKEKELKMLEADANNDANNYMRSKQETKQLQIQLKKLRQQVGGLRKKVENETRAKSKIKQEQKVDEDDPELLAEREMAAEEEEAEAAAAAATKLGRKNNGMAEENNNNNDKSPKELELEEKEKELKLLEADANDDANNYMRSKQEMKQLQIQLKKLRQYVGGLRKKVEKEKAKAKIKQEQENDEDDPELLAEREMAAEEEATAAANLGRNNNGVAEKNNEDEEEEEDEEGGGGFFDIFASTPAASSGTAQNKNDDETKPSSASIGNTTSILDFTISKDWTGTTPQKTLEETCKKQKLPKPKYFKLPKQSPGYRLSVTLKKKKGEQQQQQQQQQQEWRAEERDFIKGSSLQDYLAIQALYEMDPTLPLYRVFPPKFRDLWLSWMEQVKQDKLDATNQKDMQKKERIDELLSLINHNTLNSITTTTTAATTSSTMTTAVPDVGDDDNNHEKIFDTNTDDDWETNANDDDDNETMNVQKQVSARGKKLCNDFLRKRETPEYKNMLQVRSALPMTSYRQHVLDTVRDNPVTIICAETGAGKTTQCPQYLLEEALKTGHGVDSTNIICTQPRRVAATSVAERVAEEMCEDTIGRMVGYQIRMEAKRSADTKLLFCTTGVILRRLQEDSSLANVSHVIVDEVHERQQQTDVLLIALRQLLRSSRPDLKIILMSATLDAKLFCNFFQNAPLVSVPGRTFPVSTYFLEDLMDATDHMIEEGSRYAIREDRYNQKAALWVTNRGGEKRKEVVDLVSQTDVDDVSGLFPGYKMSTRCSMDRVNEEVINYDLIEDTLNLLLVHPQRNQTLLPPDGADFSKGSILVFLPGLGEIRSLTERLQGSRTLGDSRKFEIIPMHSTLSSRDQRRAFVASKGGSRKIILSTNIAETSVTIPDVVCVIDTGRVREVRRNKRTSTSILVTDWCSKASAKQRAGRAGRVQPGLCLKVYSSVTSENVMKPASEPELQRVPLEEVCLSILASGFAKSCKSFLSQAPQPPTNDSIQAALDVLYDVGAIELVDVGGRGGATTTSTSSSENKEKIERLTPLGQHLAKLPVDARLGKMLIFGALFRCIDKALTIAAGLSSQSPFSTFVTDAAVAKAKQRAFQDPDSDFLTICNVWEGYAEAAAISASAGRKFCQTNYLSHVALREIGDARRQFLELLSGIGFVDRECFISKKDQAPSKRIDFEKLKSSKFNENANKPELVHAVICAGLYPNIAHIEQESGVSKDYTMMHKTERLYFHNTSVNSSKTKFATPLQRWVVFHEKFGTSKTRVSVSTTCFVHPFALLLFGGGTGNSITVKHTERIVQIDDWITIGMAAQVGVIMRELRKQIDSLLLRLIEDTKGSSTVYNKTSSSLVHDGVIQGIVNLLVS